MASTHIELFTHALDQQMMLGQAYRTQLTADLFRRPLTIQAQQQLTHLRNILASHSVYSCNRQDESIWRPHQHGTFTVKSFYFTFSNTPTIETKLHRIWKLKVPPRFRIFGWLVLQDKILTHHNLIIRGFDMPGICYLCRMQVEMVQHLFDECMVTIGICARALTKLQITHTEQS